MPDLDTKLGTYFTFGELTVTTHRDLLDENREVPERLLAAGRDLCATLLDPIRESSGASLVVHSAYRCPALNTAVGGSATSQHMGFEAADFHISGVPLEQTFDWIRNQSGLKWGQLMLEGARSGPAWIHVSLGPGYRAPTKCNEVWTWTREDGYHRI